jgi:hypothetical protein
LGGQRALKCGYNFAVTGQALNAFAIATDKKVGRWII